MALPKVGVQAVLILKDFERTKKRFERLLEDMIKKARDWSRAMQGATKGLTDSFDELAKKSKGWADILDALSGSIDGTNTVTEKLKKSFEDLGEGIKIDIDKFDELIKSGASIKDAFAGAQVDVGAMAANLSLVATAATAASVALGVTLKIIRESVNQYTEFTEEVNRLRLELGSGAVEASAWARAAETAGVSATTMNRAITSVERNLVNMRLAEIEGRESSNNFTRALGALNVQVRDLDGSFKDGEQILAEVQERFQELGPGVITTGLALDIFGFSGRQLLPILLEEELAIADLQKRAEELGATVNTADIKAFREWKVATEDLKSAKEGLGNLIGRFFTPLVTELAKVATTLVNTFRQLLASLIAIEGVRLTNLLGITKISDSFQTYEENLARLTGTETEATQATIDLAKEQNELAQEAALAALAEKQLTASLEEQARVRDRLSDAMDDYLNKIVDINRRFDDQLADVDIRRGREAQARNLKLSFALEDIHIKRERRLRDLVTESASKQRDVQRDLNRKLEEFERDAARAREKIWVKHRENLLKIENTFNDTVEEAARTNDTVAVVRAIRTRNRQQRDETRRFSVEQQELEKDLAIKRDKIRDDAKRREEEEKQRADERRARIEQQFKDEIDDLIRKNQRELILSRNKDRERRDDIERNRARALRDAEIYYEREKVALQNHLRELNVTAVLAARGLTRDMVQVAADAMASLAAITSTPIARRVTEFIGGGLSRPGATTGTSAPLTGQPIDQWLRGRTPGGYRAHGGMDVVNRPTTFVAGEAGAEIAAFIPLSQSRNINHNFGKLPIDFQGLPGGMDTGQVEGIVYSAMMELARTLAGSRRS